jgi:hypothetical protein
VSIVRPELAQRLTRWREVIVWGAVLAVGLALVVRGLSPVAPLLLLAGGVAALIGAALLSAALRRMAFGTAGPAEGVVEIDEGRIGYLSPNWGGFMDVGAVVRVELVSRQGLLRGGGHAWVLTSEDGERLTIPLGARGAEGLPDALSPLPGLDLRAGAAALAGRRQGRVLVWARRASTRALASRLPPV